MERGEKRRPSSSEEANINCHLLAMGSLGQFGHVRRTANVPHALGIGEPPKLIGLARTIGELVNERCGSRILLHLMLQCAMAAWHEDTRKTSSSTAAASSSTSSREGRIPVGPGFIPRLTQLARQPPELGRALIPVIRAFGADAIWSDAAPWAGATRGFWKRGLVRNKLRPSGCGRRVAPRSVPKMLVAASRFLLVGPGVSSP
jgi:hypothetical protein